MKKIPHILVLVSILSGLMLNDCKKDPVIPTLSTTPPTDITISTAKSGGNITDDGGGTISDRGIAWSTSVNPDINGDHTSNGPGSGSYSSDMTGLNEGTTYYVRAYATNEAGTAYGNQEIFNTTSASLATVTTRIVTEVSFTSALSGGDITSDGGAEIIEKGICWSTQENPTIENSFTTSGSGNDGFAGNMTELTPGTTYYVRAYATNNKGTAYGNQETFTTASTRQATVSTRTVTDITFTTAVSGGDIPSDGGAEITEKGVCWSTSEDPVIGDNHTSDGSGSEGFSSNITGLSEGTTYYVRAYATNSLGTSYGNQETFTTPAAGQPELTTTTVTDITFTSAISGGEITSDGGAEITEKGLCWSTSENPTIEDHKTSNGTGPESFTGSLTGLSDGTTYYVRAYATNKVGTSYGNQETFTTPGAGMPELTTRTVTDITYISAVSGGDISDDGGMPVTSKGICWNTAANPTIANSHTTDGVGTAGFSSNLTGLTEGTTYYVRAYATNAKGTTYGNQQVFTTRAIDIPSVTTRAISAITATTASSGGDISTDGGAPVTEKGICWSTGENPTIQDNRTTQGTGVSGFASNMTGLFPGTTYYVRAYAVNSKGTAYGNQRTFKTLAGLATVVTSEVTGITINTAVSGGEIPSDGGSPVTGKGICWNVEEDPTIINNHTSEGAGTEAFTSNLTGLAAGVTYYVRAYATNGAGTSYGNQVIFTTDSIGLARINTRTISDITFTSARSGGDILSDGGAPITAKGICWDTSQNPTTADNHTNVGSGSESFSSDMTGLQEGTTYYVRAYAITIEGTAYGTQQFFTTPRAGLATLSTSEVSSITPVTAVTGGNITDNGGAEITVRGVCWNTAGSPTVSGPHTTDGSGSGEFTSNITDLEPETTYYLRAYATSRVGTAYGNEVTFTTISASAPVLTTAEISDLTSTSAVSGGNITYDGGSRITARGVCWGTSPEPDITGNHTTNGTGSGVFTSTVNGLTNGTVYYLRAYATNSVGTTYGNEVSFITPVTDIEGNVYRTVQIGNQVWMAENLRTRRLNDNTELMYITSSSQWVAQDSLHNPAYSWYLNTTANRTVYGGLYNWFAVGTEMLCPDGWHVPQDADFEVLELELGVPIDSIDAWGWRGVGVGTALKSSTEWDGNNSSGFDALPAGYRMWVNGQFSGLGTITYFWTATDDSGNLKPELAWYRRLDIGESRIYKATTYKAGGKSIRCVKD